MSGSGHARRLASVEIPTRTHEVEDTGTMFAPSRVFRCVRLSDVRGRRNSGGSPAFRLCPALGGCTRGRPKAGANPKGGGGHPGSVAGSREEGGKPSAAVRLASTSRLGYEELD